MVIHMIVKYMARIKEIIEELNSLLEQADIPENKKLEIHEKLCVMEEIVNKHEKMTRA